MSYDTSDFYVVLYTTPNWLMLIGMLCVLTFCLCSFLCSHLLIARSLYMCMFVCVFFLVCLLSYRFIFMFQISIVFRLHDLQHGDMEMSKKVDKWKEKGERESIIVYTNARNWHTLHIFNIVSTCNDTTDHLKYALSLSLFSSFSHVYCILFSFSSLSLIHIHTQRQTY